MYNAAVDGVEKHLLSKEGSHTFLHEVTLKLASVPSMETIPFEIQLALLVGSLALLKIRCRCT